jgi:hypothetical protein
VQTPQEILQKWDKRTARFRRRMEITGEGLMLGAGTVLAKMSRDRGGMPRHAAYDEPRVMALLATAYERPGETFVVAKLTRACELWNEGEKALAHIHLAHTGLPICNEGRALRLFAADELLESGVTPQVLLEAQGFDPATLGFLKYNPDQPRVPAGSGRESRRWTSDGGGGSEGSDAAGSEDGATSEDLIEGRSSSSISIASNEKERDYEDRRARGQESPKEDVEHGRGVPLLPEGPLGLPLPSEGATEPASPPKPSDFVGQDFGKLGTAVEKPDVAIAEVTGHASERMTEYGQSIDDIQSIVSDPLIVLQQSDGRYYFLSDTGAVVVDQQGRIVTTYPASQFGVDVKAILDFIHSRGKR